MKDNQLEFDLFGPMPVKDKMSDEEITRKLCPRCWNSCDRKVDGEDFCVICNCALKYLKPRPFANRNDP